MIIPKSTPKFFWHYIKLQPLAFGFLFFTAMIWAVNEAFFPYFLKLMINAITYYTGPRTEVIAVLAKPLSMLFGLWLIMEVSMRTQGFTIAKTFPKFRAHIRRDIFAYVRQHSHSYFSNNFAGSIANKIAELPAACERILEIFLFNFISFSMLFFFAVVLMALVNPLFAVIILLWAGSHLFIAYKFFQKGNVLSQHHASAASNLSGKIVDALSNIASVRLFARGQYESEYLSEYQAEELSKANRSLFILEKMKIVQGILTLIFIFSMLSTLIYGWIHQWVSVGDFTLIGMLSFWLLGFLWFISYQITIFVREYGKIHSALELISLDHEIRDASNAKPLSVTQGQIAFHQVTFRYNDSMSLFDDLNFTISSGEKVGLVGFSGSGKSTLVNLILRFFDLQQGHIAIDQQDIAQVTHDSLRSQIAMIPQDPSLFHRSLMENIRYGRLDASDEEVKEAAKLAHCDEFISQLPEGYQTLVGERGVKLSGGQRQRIAIARAILKNAPILILDEATSSLDTVTERLIQQSLHQLMNNRTTIVIAHRLSTLTEMDRIIVFDKGKIIEDGSWSELLESKGHLAHMVKLQQDGFLPD